MVIASASASADPVQLLWDVDYGPMLLDPATPVVLARVDGVVSGRANGTGEVPSRLRLEIDRSLRGPFKAGDPLELPFTKQLHYKTPVDKSRAFHDQWQELAFHRGDMLVFLLSTDTQKWTPLAVLQVADAAADEVQDLARCVDSKRPLVDVVTEALHSPHAISETFARAALGSHSALTRAELAAAVADVIGTATVDAAKRDTWALYDQHVFDVAQGGDAPNVLVVQSLLAASLAGSASPMSSYVSLLHQFIVQDWNGKPDVSGRVALLKAVPAKLRTTAAATYRRWAAATTGDYAAEYRALAAVVAP